MSPSHPLGSFFFVLFLFFAFFFGDEMCLPLGFFLFYFFLFLFFFLVVKSTATSYVAKAPFHFIS